jgi:large subunit ribosomal protein L19
MKKLDALQPQPLRRDLPPFRSGDTVRIHVKIQEGEKERIQVFEGLVIRRRGSGASATFTVRKISYGVGVERVFLIQSPAVAKVEIKGRGHVRRARLYYLRDLAGKKARLRSKIRDLAGLMGDTGEAGTAMAALAEEPSAAAPPEAGEAEAEERS